MDNISFVFRDKEYAQSFYESLVFGIVQLNQ